MTVVVLNELQNDPLLNELLSAISINVVGSKHKARRQDRKVMWEFFSE